MRNSKKTRIAIITPNLQGAGWERLLSEILPFLLSSFEVDIILYEKKINYPLPKDINLISLDLSTNPNINFFAKIWRFAKRITKIGLLLKKKQYDIIFSALETTNIATYFATKFFNINKPIIVSERAINYNFFQKNLYAKKILLFLNSY